RPDFVRFADELEPIHLRHGVIDDEKVGRGLAGEDAPRSRWTICLVNGVPYPAEDLPDQRTHIVIVIAQQDMTILVRHDESRPRWSALFRWQSISAGQPDLDGRSLAEVTSNQDRPSGLSGEAMHHRQSEARTHSNFFGRKEWLDGPREGRLIHTAAIIDHRQDNKLTRS